MSREPDVIGRAGPRLVRAAVLAALALSATTCKVGELVSPSPPGELAVSPASAHDSAAVGSRPVRVVKIGLRSTGPGTIDWTAALARGSGWVRLAASAGSTPDSLALALDPAGLFVGDYHDTVQVAPADGSAEPTTIPVTFSVQPCRERSLAVGGTVSDSIVEADCEAPHRADRFAKLYRFSAQTAGDSVTVVVRSTAFDPYVLLDSATTGNVAPLAEADRCGAEGDAACVRYALLPRAGAFFVEVTSGGTGEDTGAFTLEIQAPRSPPAPTGVGQFAGDSVTPIAAGGAIADSTFIVRATATDPDLADSLALEVEVQPFGTPFSGTPSAAGAFGGAGPLAVRVPGLADNTSYHWQVRTRDETGRVSAWVAFGTGGADLQVAVSERPAVPTGIGQYRSDGSTAIAAGGGTNEGTVVFKGTVTDPDPADQVRLEVEVQAFGTAFTGTPTAAGVLVASGAMASVTATGLSDGVAYHWRVRTVDQTARASDWVPFAPPGQTTEDFRVELLATGLAFGTQPSDITAGSVINPVVTVEARKPSGVVDTAFAGVIDVVIVPGTGTVGAVLSGTLSRAAVAGIASFPDLSVDRAGADYRLLASAQGLNPATSGTFGVSASGATKLALVTPPSDTARSGSAFDRQPIVQLRDASDNPVAQAGVPVVAVIASGPGGSLLRGETVNTDGTGAATFSELAVVGLVGTYTVRFAATGLTAALSNPIEIVVGDADPSQTTANVPNGVAGSPTAIQVTARDPGGNPVPVGGGTVAVVVSGANSATPPVTDNGDGTYTANYVPGVAGTDTVAITFNGSPISGTPYASLVTAGSGATLAFLTVPDPAVAGATLAPPLQVAVQDAGGNVTPSSADITIAIGSNPGGGTLSGTRTVRAVNGIATFSSLSIEKAGTGYTLVASSPGLAPDTSAAFAVTFAPAAKVAFTTPPIDVVAGATMAAVQVTVQDAFGNTVDSATAPVQVAIGVNPGGGTLSGPTMANPVNGVATFSGLSIEKSGVGYTLAATSGTLSGATSTGFSVTPAAAVAIAFVRSPPASAVAGAPMAPPILVAVQDPFGNTVTSSTASVRVAIGTNPTGGVLSGDTVVSAVAGVAAFSTLSIDRAGTGYTLAATSTGLGGATSAPFDIVVGSGNKLAFVVQPSNAEVGAANVPAIQVAIQDASGNTIPGASDAVTLVIADNPGGGTLSGTTVVDASNGIAVFSNVRIDRVGANYTLTAFGSGLVTATSAPFTVTPAATTTAVASSVNPSVFGQSVTFTATVTAVTPAAGTPVGNVQFKIDGANLGGPVALNAAGLATSSATAAMAVGTHVVTAEYVGSTNYAASSGILAGGHVVNPAATTTAVTSSANPSVFGQGITFTATVTTVAPGSGVPSGTVQFKVDGTNLGAPVVLSAGGQATSPATSTLGAGTHGITAEYTPSASYAASTGTLAGGQVVNGAPTSTAVVSSANPSVFGQGVTFTATVASGFGTPTGNVQFKVDGTNLGDAVPLNGSGQAVSPATTPAVGTHTVTADYLGVTNYAASAGTLAGGQVVNRAGTSTTVTSDLSTATVVGQSYTVAVSVAAVAPGAGTPGGSVTVSDGTGATCSAPLTNGAGSCSLTSVSAGTKAVTGTYVTTTDFSTSTSTGVSHLVNAATTTTAITSDLSTPTAAGQAYTVAVSVAAVAPGGGTPTGNVTVSDGTGPTCNATLSNGAGSCQLTSTTAGTKSVTGTYVATSDYLTSTSAPVSHVVNPATADTLRAVSSLTPTGSVGTAATPAPAVIVVDGFGNPVSGIDVTFTPSAGSVSSGTVTTGANGQATVAWTLGPTAGPQTLTAASGTLVGSPITFTATAVAGTATKLAFTRSPPAVVPAAAAITPSVLVAVQDANGNTVTTATASITVDIGSNPASGTLSGTKTAAAVNGVATFADLSIEMAGSPYTLTATAPSTGLAGATSTAFEVAVGTGQKLGFLVEPSNAVVLAPNTPAIQVAVQDAGGNTVDTATNQIGLLLTTNPGGATLSGTTVVAAVNGIATFTNVRIDKAANGYVLTAANASGGVVQAGTSTPFNIAPAATATTVTSNLSTATVVGQPYTVAVSVAVVAPGGGTPGGSVTVSDGTGATCSATLTAGTGSCSLTSTTAGTKTVTGSYVATADYAASTSSGTTHPVNPAATTTTITGDGPDPSLVGQPVPVTYTVTANAPGAGTPTGNVTVTDGAGTSCVGTVAAGACNLTFLTSGAKTLTATYATDGNFAGSTTAAGTAHQVNAAATTTTITSDLSTATVVGQAYTVAVAVAAVAPGGGTPTGTVTVSDGAGASCGVTLAGGAGSCLLTSTSAGTKSVTATYGGTVNYGASASAGVSHPVNTAATATAVAASVNPSVFGQSVTFSVTVTAVAPGTGTPTGNVQFKVDGVNLGGAVALSAGQAQVSTASLAAGTRGVTAEYAGSANYQASTGTLSPSQSVQAAATATAVTSSGSPSTFGQSVTFTATVTTVAPGAGTPAGTVQFKADGANLGAAVPLDGAGQAQVTTASLAAGTRVITAEYSGAANFAASTGGLAGGQVVTPAATATSLASSANPSVFGQSVTFTATVTSAAGTPGGTVQFKVDGVNLGAAVALDGAGQAQATTTGLAVGAHTVTAEYSGTANFAASTGTLAGGQTVNAASTTTAVASSVNPSAFGQSVTFTATVAVVAPGAGVPSGTVQFQVDAVDFGAPVALVGGVATSGATAALAAGTHTVTATYLPTGSSFTGSTGTLAGGQVVSPAGTATAVSSSVNPSVVGQDVTFTAAVTVVAPGAGTPPGAVQFQVDGADFGAPVALAAGQATSAATAALAVGTHAVTATYVPTGTNFSGSGGTLTGGQVVNKAATTTTVTSNLSAATVVGEPYAVAVSVAAVAPGAGSPTGSVTVSDGTGATCTIASLTAGTGSCNLTSTTAGAKTVTASYAGDAGFLASASAGTAHTVNVASTTTTVGASANPSVFGQGVTFTATVAAVAPGSGTPSGNVRFQVDGVNFGTPVALAGGVATSQIASSLSVGTHTVTASFLGSANFAASSGTLTGGQVVNKAATTTAITSDLSAATVVGQAYAVAVSVAAVAPGAGSPTGGVTVADGTGATCTIVSLTAGAGSCNLTSTTAGTKTVTATYAGDVNFLGSPSAGTLHTVDPAPTSTTITSSLSTATVVGQSYTVSYSVTSAGGTPTGSVTVSDGTASCEGTAAAGGCPLVSTTAGSKTVTATYAGDGNFTGSASPGVAHQVNAASTTTTVTSDLSAATVVGEPYTVAVTVAPVAPGAGTPTGSVSVGDGSGATCTITALASGSGSCDLTSTTAGAKTVTASYDGTTDYAASASAGTAHQVNAFGAATRFVILDPTDGTVDAPITVTVQALDAFGNLVASETRDVTLTTSGSASGGGLVDIVNGVGTRDISNTVAETVNLGLSDTQGTGLDVTSTQDVVFGVGALASFLVEAAATGPIGTQTAGTSFDIRVTARDGGGNTVTGFTETVDITSNATLSAGGGTTAAFVGGVLASRSVTITNTGSFTLTATRTSGGAQSGTSTAFAVQAGAASAAASTAVVPVGTAGSPTNITVTVRDDLGNKVPGQAGLVAGSVIGANTATLAPASEQTSDTTYTTSYTPNAPGADTVAITVGATPVSGSPFESIVAPGAAAALSVVDGDGQTMLIGKAVNVAPRILVEDAQGNPVPGASVDLAVTSGGGSVGTATAVADGAGVATVNGWIVGPAPGANALRVAVPGDTITISATGQAAAFTVEVRYFGDLPTSSQQAAFTAAATRWGQLIFGDVPDVPMSLAADWCTTTGVPAISEIIDDVVIYAQVTPIDGAGGILGQAGPCYVRTTGGLPILGIMRFDSADLAGLESGGQLELVILHEMGHVLGLGTLWDLTLSGTPVFALLANPCPSAPAPCSTDPHFTGGRGREAFDAIGGTSYAAGEKVPVEDTGGDGTRNGHWRETVFGSELMTGYLNGGASPLSAVSIGSFWDMAYAVVYTDAESFAWSPAPSALEAGGIDLANDLLGKPIGVVGPGGQVERVIQPER